MLDANGCETGHNDSTMRASLPASDRRQQAIDREKVSRGSGETEADIRRIDTNNT